MPRRSCNEKTLHRYIDGDLSLDERVVFEAHLDECRPCSALLETCRVVDDTVHYTFDTLCSDKDVENAWDQLSSAISGDRIISATLNTGNTGFFANKRFIGTAAAAACFFLLLNVSYLWYTKWDSAAQANCYIDTIEAARYPVMVFKTPVSGSTVVWIFDQGAAGEHGSDNERKTDHV